MRHLHTKVMALFESQEVKDARIKQYMEERGLQNLNNDEDFESIRRALVHLNAGKYFDTAAFLGNTNATIEKVGVTASVIVEQNYILIRQLDRLTKLLEEKE